MTERIHFGSLQAKGNTAVLVENVSESKVGIEYGKLEDKTKTAQAKEREEHDQELLKEFEKKVLKQLTRN